MKRNSDYALRALVYLSHLEPGKIASARSISAAQDVPEALLRKLLQQLCRAGIVASEQGTRGGFRLAKPASEVTIFDIVETVQGKVAINRCYMEDKGCPRKPRCRISPRLRPMQDRLVDCFRQTTLSEVAATNGYIRGERASH